MALPQILEAPLHGRALQPLRNRVGADLNEHTFAAILDGGKPPRLQGDFRAFHVGVVLAVDVRHHGFQFG